MCSVHQDCGHCRINSVFFQVFFQVFFRHSPLHRPLKVQQTNPLVRDGNLGAGGGFVFVLKIRSRTGTISALLDRDRLVSGKTDRSRSGRCSWSTHLTQNDGFVNDLKSLISALQWTILNSCPEGDILKMGILVWVPLPTSQMACEKWDISFPDSHFSLLNSHFSPLNSHFSLLNSHFSYLTS